MTRETKIGLLVGLAFIIVIGILLSDHLSAIEPAPAQLAGVGDSVRSGAAVPPPQNPIITLAAPQPAGGTPTRPVPTRDELTPPGNAVVRISPPAAGEQPINIKNTNLPQPREAVASNQQPSRTETPTTTGNVPTNLRDVARQHDVELVDTGNTGTMVMHNATTQVTNVTQVATVSGKQYQAQSDDTVSKLARKFYGSNTKTTRDLIINANPSLKASPDKITVGKTYVIPELPAARTASLTVAPTTRPSAPTRLTVTTASYTTYTVKDNDTLWQIASTQCGNGGLADQILTLNKDVLKSATKLRAGMQLKLPSKPIATASARD